VKLVTVNELNTCGMTAIACDLGLVLTRGLAEFAAIFSGRGDLALTREMSTFFRSRLHGANLSVCSQALAASKSRAQMLFLTPRLSIQRRMC